MAEPAVQSEPTVDPAEVAALKDVARQIDRERMKQIGGYHFAMSMGAITLWGAAVAWAQVTGWGWAGLVAVANAVVAGYVLSSVIHEWGHFSGARLSGAVSPVLEEPKRHFFMFDFPMDQNDTNQFVWMSWGGILAPWALVLLVLLLVPLSLTSGAALLATLIYRAVAVWIFESPVARRAAVSGEPGAELGKQLAAGALARGRNVGAMVGAACFVLLWMAA